MDSGGRFLVDRNIFEGRLWGDVIKFRLFFYILGKAAFKDNIIVDGAKLKRGQYLRSYRNLANDLQYKEGKSLKKYSLATLKRKINELIKEKRIEIKETSKGTLFTVKNYEKYQCFKMVKSVSENDSETIAKQEELNIINANNANKAADDARAGEDVPTTSPSVEAGEDVPTTSPSADDAAERAMKLMEKLYFRYTGRMVNSLDFVAMSEIAELTTDEKLIGSVMKTASERYKPRFEGDKIRSFKYFSLAVKEAAARERVRKNAMCERNNKTFADGKGFKDSGGLKEISEDDFNSRLSCL